MRLPIISFPITPIMQGAWWGALMATWREIFSRNMGFWVVSRCFTKEMKTIYSLFRFRQDVKRFYIGFKGNIYEVHPNFGNYFA